MPRPLEIAKLTKASWTPQTAARLTISSGMKRRERRFANGPEVLSEGPASSRRQHPARYAAGGVRNVRWKARTISVLHARRRGRAATALDQPRALSDPGRTPRARGGAAACPGRERRRATVPAQRGRRLAFQGEEARQAGPVRRSGLAPRLRARRDQLVFRVPRHEGAGRSAGAPPLSDLHPDGEQRAPAAYLSGPRGPRQDPARLRSGDTRGGSQDRRENSGIR